MSTPSKAEREKAFEIVEAELREMTVYVSSGEHDVDGAVLWDPESDEGLSLMKALDLWAQQRAGE